MPPVSPLQLFKSLSDETRLSLVLLLREKGELCVCELTSVLKENSAQNLTASGSAERKRAAYRPAGRKMDPLSSVASYAGVGSGGYRTGLSLPAG
nr:ArsR family transcriptional regulator [Raoultella sp. NCTC 9187]